MDHKEGGSVGTYLTLAESWNGSKWSISSTPNVSGSNDNYLSGVSCNSTTSCQAVGYYVNGSGVDQTLAESWNGSGWTLLGSPNVGAGDNELTSLSCKSATSCQAVGYDVNGSGDYQTLAESWNGSSWSLATSSDIGTSNNQLYGVSCKKASCQAVGDFFNASQTPQAYNTLAEAWNGSTWSTESSPNASPFYNNAMYSAACPSKLSCEAVGHYVSQYVNSVGTYLTLAESWNGSSWSVQTTPNVSGSNDNYLYGVSCPTTTSCQAVGYYVNGSGVDETLIEKY